ncbi:MAG: thiolase family protein [Actinomycetota bacterium]
MDHSVAIVGVGEVRHGRFPDRPSLEMALDVSGQAIAHAGLEAREIDAVLIAPAFADTAFNTDMAFGRLVEELGMRNSAKIVMQVGAGGSTGDRLLRTARGLIASGQARYVLCVHADKFTELTKNEILEFFAVAGFDTEFEAPYGVTYNTIAGLSAQRYLYETGQTEYAIADMTSSLREWGSLDVHASGYGKPMTTEQVLATPILQWPIRTAMAPPPADGASAFVVAGAEDAKALRDSAAYVIAESSRVRTYSFTQHDDITKMGWAESADEAFAEAGITRDQVGIAQFYMAYPIFHLILLEEFGFCERGRAGEFVASGATRPGGRLPVMTTGDAIGHGHTGSGVGVATLVDTARQLMGESGGRQVDDLEFVVETSCGGSYMDTNVVIFGREPR